MNKSKGLVHMKPKLFPSFVLIILLLILSSCIQKPISIITLNAPEEIKQGDSAIISWKFKNTDKVIINNINKVFCANDSVVVIPKQTSTYIITAIQDNRDTIMQLCSIKVTPVISGKGITRGEFKLANYKLEPSIFNSDYLCGEEDFLKVQAFSSLRIVQTKFNKQTNSTIIKAILLDKFGNLVKNINSKDVKWGIKTTFGAISHYFDVSEKFRSEYKERQSALFAFLIDLSASTNNSHIIENIKNFILRISPEDSIMIVAYNQDTNLLIQPMDVATAFTFLDKTTFPESNGLSALYPSAFKALREIEKLPNKNKYLIIITGNNNNSYSSYKSEDISNYANKLGIPIYIIGTGYSFDPYPLRYLSHSTGGTYYSCDLETEAYKIDRMIFEIAYSNIMQHYFEFTVLIPAETCKLLLTQLNFFYKNINLTDNVNIILKYDEPYQKSRIIALFEHHSDIVSDDYFPIINDLSNYLILNPDKKIELIGTRSMEEEILSERDISQTRAEQIKQKLIEIGVKPEQIKISGKGASLPLYYFEKEEWQKAYNRRVEMRWLSPELQPFEILAETCISEDEAQKKVEIWEQRGYRAYYERYISFRNPVYKVKIWGFAVEEEANRIASQINVKWGTNFKVE